MSEKVSLIPVDAAKSALEAGNIKAVNVVLIGLAARNTDIPCLFIHGGDDDFVPVRMSIENFYACQAPKELLIVPGAGHGLSYLVDPVRYRERVLAFFSAWDDRVPPPQPPEPQKRRSKKSKIGV